MCRGPPEPRREGGWRNQESLHTQSTFAGSWRMGKEDEEPTADSILAWRGGTAQAKMWVRKDKKVPGKQAQRGTHRKLQGKKRLSQTDGQRSLGVAALASVGNRGHSGLQSMMRSHQTAKQQRILKETCGPHCLS